MLHRPRLLVMNSVSSDYFIYINYQKISRTYNLIAIQKILLRILFRLPLNLKGKTSLGIAKFVNRSCSISLLSPKCLTLCIWQTFCTTSLARQKFLNNFEMLLFVVVFIHIFIPYCYYKLIRYFFYIQQHVSQIRVEHTTSPKSLSRPMHKVFNNSKGSENCRDQ